jgi:iron complex transport system substrate-binding protein
MRVVSLLPAATEIVAALGGAGQLVGISHECDYPDSVLGLPRVTTTPVNSSASSGDIDDDVRRLRAAGKPIIGIEAEQLRRLAPDLIITQGLCEVCAVADGEVYRLARTMPSPPRVLSLGGHDLAGIWSDIRQVGSALDLEDDADELVMGLEGRLTRMRAASPQRRLRTVCIEWLDPLYLAGHWVPELVEAAGGEEVGGHSGQYSRRHEWAHVKSLRPDQLVVMLCGFGIDRARAELDSLDDPIALDVLGGAPVWIIDGNAYTSRPGPRVVDGASRLQLAMRGCEGDGVERWKRS